MNNTAYTILDKVNSPADIKGLSMEQLKVLCSEIRHYMIECCSVNPGHLGPSLGAVELIVGLHYVFDAPSDKLIFDVGHQAYAHKIITGRREAFRKNRMKDGISGFPRRSESVYDSFGAGHSSTSVSAALGFAEAAKQQGLSHKSVALIGDGSLTGGLAFEGLNNAGASKADIIVILNDNKISIDRNVGAIHNYLLRMTTNPNYNKAKKHIWDKLGDNWFRKTIQKIVTTTKSHLVSDSGGHLFQAMGFRYFGPIDGNDIVQTIDTLKKLKDMKGPILLHTLTKKGKGYAPAEENQTVWHAPGLFDPETGERIRKDNGISRYQDVFGGVLLELAGMNEKVVGITPAMSSGCGMNRLAEVMPARFYDVGIEEEHAVTFAAGLAAGGMKPFCNIYSSFSQRAYDQIIHDVALQQLPVLMCIDRAGLNAGDGPTHHGLFDVSFLSGIPGMTIYTPVTFAGLETSVRKALADGVPAAIRYPNGGEDELLKKTFYPDGDPTDVGLRESDPANHAAPAAVIITHGRITREALAARERLAAEDIPVGILLCEYLKPYGRLADEIASRLPAGVPLLFVEEEIRAGGFGMMLTDALRKNGGLDGHPFGILAVDDSFVPQDKPEPILRTAGVDAEAMVAKIKELLGR